MYQYLLLLAALLFISNSCAQREDISDSHDGSFRHLDIEAGRFKKHNKIKGLAVALFDNEQVIWKLTAGRSTYGQAINDSTLFGIQSVSKNLTALAVMLAAQEGLLDLDTPVATYLPGFSVSSCFEENAEAVITLRMLLSHTAGLTHEAPVGNNYDFNFHSMEEHLESIRDSWLRFPAGTAYAYSNLGYDLAAEIIEQVSGVPFVGYMEAKLFHPLGMTHSTVSDETFASATNKTEGVMNGVKVKHYPIPLIGSGAVYASLSDMVKYVRFHLNYGSHNGRQVSDQLSLFEMYSIVMNNYGLGTYIDTLHGSFYLNHNGGGFGYGSSILWMPEYNIGCVVLANKPANCFTLASSVISQFIQESNPHRKRDTIRTGDFNPFNNEMAGKEIHRPKPCGTDSIYRKEWDRHTGSYEVLIGGMEFKWYARLFFTFAKKPHTLKLFRQEDEFRMEGSFGRSKLYEYRPGLFFTRDGAALDLRNDIPVYDNLRLVKYR